MNNIYYSPILGRFINADGIINGNLDITGYNLYAYCSNNPIIYNDKDGEGLLFASGVFLLAGLAGKLLSDAYTSVMNKKLTMSPANEYVSAGVSSVIGGITSLTYGPKAGSAASAVVSSAIDYGYEYINSGKKPSLAKTVINGVLDYTVSSKFDLEMKGVTKGRNSFSAVFESGYTKLKHGVAKRMSPKVQAKGFISEIGNNGMSIIFDGGRNYIEEQLSPYFSKPSDTTINPYVCYKWDY